MRVNKNILVIMVLGLLIVPLAAAQEPNSEDSTETIGLTPPRLSFVDGQVSFWRPGSEDWVDAQINTPLAPGDRLLAGPDGNLELQIGAQAFVRAGAGAQITLDRREPDFLQFNVIEGTVALDMRRVDPGRMVVVETPHAVFNIEAEGYYRLDVDDGQTHFITRRTGRALVALNSGEEVPIQSNESITIAGEGSGRMTANNAPALDEWDLWNYARTDRFFEERNNAYVSPEVYGANDLDHHGSWIVTEAYGPVWRPWGVAVGWVPYSTGVWMSDPCYGWTWVDTAPWGWAPYHYGRWVFVNSYWCWAPGPRVVRPVYAPALVAFFGEPGVQVGIGIGGPVVGWVALGWGEPLVPWWGRPGFIHRPWWGGWGGPHCLNGRVISHGAVVNVSQINVYQNMHRHHAMVMVHGNQFGRVPVTRALVTHGDVNSLRPLRGAPRDAAPPHGRAATNGHHVRPSQQRPSPSIRPSAPHKAMPPQYGGSSRFPRIEGQRGGVSAPAREAPERNKEDRHRIERSPMGNATRDFRQSLAPQQSSSKQVGTPQAPMARSGARSMASQPRPGPNASHGPDGPAARGWRSANGGADRSFQVKEEQSRRAGSRHSRWGQ